MTPEKDNVTTLIEIQKRGSEAYGAAVALHKVSMLILDIIESAGDADTTLLSQLGLKITDWKYEEKRHLDAANKEITALNGKVTA